MYFNVGNERWCMYSTCNYLLVFSLPGHAMMYSVPYFFLTSVNDINLYLQI